MAKLTRKQWMHIGRLVEDIFLTIAVPLGIVLYVFHDLSGGATPLPNLPSTSPQNTIIAVFPQISFATLFMWALARRRLTACEVKSPMPLDFVVLAGVVLSGITIGAMLKYTWTGKVVEVWVITFQIVLLLVAIGFNAMITVVDCRLLGGSAEVEPPDAS